MRVSTHSVKVLSVFCGSSPYSFETVSPNTGLTLGALLAWLFEARLAMKKRKGSLYLQAPPHWLTGGSNCIWIFMSVRGIQAEVFMSLSKLANAPGCFSSPVIMILFLSPVYVSLIDTLTGNLNRRQQPHLHISCPSPGGLTIVASISYGQRTSNSPLLGLPYLVASWNRRTPFPLFLESSVLEM